MTDSELNPRSAAYALLIHSILVALLWWGASWVQPKPTEVELWDASGSSAMSPAEPAPIVNETEPEVVKAQEPAELTVKEQQKPNAEPAKPAPSKPNTPAVAKPTHSTQTNDVLKNAMGGAGSKPAAQGSGNYNEYASKVKATVESSARGLAGKSAVVNINISATGQIMGKRIVRGSGDAAWDARLLAAITRMPPNPPEAAQGGKLTLTIRP